MANNKGGSLKSKLVVIGTKSKEILKYKPAELFIEEHVTYSYACKVCEETEGKANIVTTKSPNTLLYKSMASNELLSHVINLKCQLALPLYVSVKNSPSLFLIISLIN